MDKKELYEKAEKALNHAFEAAKSSVKTVSEKAGEAAHITRLLIEKTTLEHKINKEFSQLGSQVYENYLSVGKSAPLNDDRIKELVENVNKMNGELDKVEKTIAKEKKQRQAKKK